MKKILTSIGIVLLAVVLCGGIMLKRDYKSFNAKIYYIDHSMLRLIPVDYSISKSTKEKAVEKLIDELISGQEKNQKILRVIPNDDCMEVKVKNNTATVNFKKAFIKNKPTNKIHGLLCVYQIVNSLTSIDGIDTVRFLIDGKADKGFVSGLDMREVFIPDYYM